MNATALGLAALAMVAALESARRAFGVGPGALARTAISGAEVLVRGAATAVERPVERALPGRGRLGAALLVSLGAVALGAGLLIAGVVGALLVALTLGAGATVAVRLLERRRRLALGRQVPELCERVAATVRAGRSLRAAISHAAEEASGSGASELASIRRELDLGARLDSALEAACASADVPELRALSATIEVQQRSGGSLASALEGLAKRLREDARLRADVRAATAQARASAWLVAGLPVAGGLAFELAAPGSASALLEAPLGLAVIGVSATMYAIGIAAIVRMSRADP